MQRQIHGGRIVATETTYLVLGERRNDIEQRRAQEPPYSPTGFQKPPHRRSQSVVRRPYWRILFFGSSCVVASRGVRRGDTQTPGQLARERGSANDQRRSRALDLRGGLRSVSGDG